MRNECINYCFDTNNTVTALLPQGKRFYQSDVGSNEKFKRRTVQKQPHSIPSKWKNVKKKKRIASLGGMREVAGSLRNTHIHIGTV